MFTLKRMAAAVASIALVGGVGAGAGIAAADIAAPAQSPTTTIRPGPHVTDWCITYGTNLPTYDWDQVACPAGSYPLSFISDESGTPTPPAPTAATETFTLSGLSPFSETLFVPAGDHVAGTPTVVDASKASESVPVASITAGGHLTLGTAITAEKAGDVIIVSYQYIP